MNPNANLLQTFDAKFGGKPELIARAPGRVNLIGEHTDYNAGFVLPMAINYDVRIAAHARADRTVRIYSCEFEQEDIFELDAIQRTGATPLWMDYVRGIADVLMREKFSLRGMDAVISGNVPRGAGLSSSAAIELAVLTAFRALNALEIDPVRAAILGQRAENEFIGLQCGIMDQFISSLGQANHALFIDCRSLEYQLIPLPKDISVVVVDSGVRRGLVESAYNERRSQCELGAAAMNVNKLRDMSAAGFKFFETQLPPLIAQRCRHVITENERVTRSVAVLLAGDITTFGELMSASHASLRDDFQVSTRELDALVEIQQQIPGCLGVRMTGAGFGGCTVALVRPAVVAGLIESVETEYAARTGRVAQVYVCHAVDGASWEKV